MSTRTAVGHKPTRAPILSSVRAETKVPSKPKPKATKAVLPETRPPPPLAPPPVAGAASDDWADARAVAGRISGLPDGRFTLETTRIEQGLANVGVFIHAVAPLDGSAAPLRFIEKRTKKSAETEYAPALQSLVFPSGLSIGPAIYDVIENAGYQTIMMEFVAGDPLADRLAFEGEESDIVSELVEALLIIASYRGPLTENRFKLERPIAGMLEVANMPETSERDRRLLTEMAQATPPKFRAIVECLPTVACHNDAYFGNFFRCEDRDGIKRIRLIDWGMCGYNLVGADLHHFVSAAFEQPALQPMVDMLIERYCSGLVARGMAVTPRDILGGALCYAWTRSLVRMKRKSTTNTVPRVAKIAGKIAELVG